MFLNCYRTLMHACVPVMPVYLNWRVRKGLEEQSCLPERYGQATRTRPNGKLIWVHAASVGEMRSSLPLVQHILKHNDDVTCLITTVTHTAARLVRGLKQDRILHQYSPIDHPAWIDRFLHHWKPDAVFWMESELWPTTLEAIKNKHIPLIMLNGRMSERSTKRWSMVPKTIQLILSHFDLLIAQSDEDAKRLEQLSARDVHGHGNIKYVGMSLPIDDADLDKLRDDIGIRPVILFASTHEGEEEIAANVHTALSTQFPSLVSIVMPRHPARGDDIANMFKKRGLKVSRRSLSEPISSDKNIYLADTLGEAGLFYALCRVVYMGNSLIDKPGGGHNPIEPAMHDCAILYGPNMWNFDDIDKGLRTCGGARMVQNTDTLISSITEFLNNDKIAQEMAKSARSFVDAQAGILGNVVNDLRPILTTVGINA